MKSKLLFASMLTLGILVSFVLFVFFLIAYWADIINFPVLIGLTVFTNLILWLISPAITDWIQGWVYKIERMSFELFSNRHPELASFLQQTCVNAHIPVPRLRFIKDDNPTAYCYGSYPANARLVISAGIVKYLNLEEQKAVVAHELGHIVNRDFIVMTVAVTLLQILYEIYYALMKRRNRSRSNGKKDITPLIGVIAYVLYFIGSYLVLYLSRTREYLADRFSAEATKNPDALSMALVKIAYGISEEVDTESTNRLLAATRSLGISDFKSAIGVGSAYKLVSGKNEDDQSRDLTHVFLFDLFSPWASLSEINSTHPLTGKRIQAMSRCCKEMGIDSRFDFNSIREAGSRLDKKKLYENFWSGVAALCMPMLGLLAALITLGANPAGYAFALAWAGLGVLALGLYKFQRSGGQPEHTTVLELMQDPYANPVRGRYVQLEGRVIGKADAGSQFGEDVKMQDRSGGLIMLNYESPFPFLGNLFFGLNQAKKLIGSAITATGWFRRTSYQILDLDTLTESSKTIKSYTRFWEINTGIIMIAIAALLLIFK